MMAANTVNVESLQNPSSWPSFRGGGVQIFRIVMDTICAMDIDNFPYLDFPLLAIIKID